MKYTKEFIENIVKNSICVWDVVEQCGMSKQEGNYRYISRIINRYNIDKSHFQNQRRGNRKRKSLDNILIKGEFLTLSGNNLKNKLYEAGLKKPLCEICGQNDFWRGIKISLILDHIDGDRKNNELDNLRILCPNCNATLDTHCGKNRKK